MKKPIFTLCFFFTINILIHCQPKHYCGTLQESSEWLNTFQENISTYEKSSDILYVPVTIHLVGTDSGEGYFPLKGVFDELCGLNMNFEQADIQFFLNEINYIDNSNWYQGNAIVEMMNANNVENNINCYIVNTATTGFLGNYVASADAIVMAKFGFGIDYPLFAHEIGHYFSLAHTFWGWESITWDYSTSAPEFVGGRKVERVDGQDCDIAGDGFCDTPPDYLNGIGQSVTYTCNGLQESFIIQKDPTGAAFQTDCSLIMSYAPNGNRFSEMQISAMRANIEQQRPYLLDNQDPLPEIITTNIELTSPIQNAMVDAADPLSLEWGTISNATNYIVELTYLPVFSVVYDSYIVEGNSLIIENLLENKNYQWRVRPYNIFHTCTSFSAVGNFSTGTPLECERSQIIGTTIYDLQTNGSTCNRISLDDTGNIMATWTMSLNVSNGYGDRGTGYNRYDVSMENWGPAPTQRLEPNTRTGWPNHIITESGTELIVNHVFESNGIFLHSWRREAGNSNWIHSQVPTNTPRGVFASRMVVSGETVHLIAVTPPLNFGGVLFEEVNGHVLYYRSSDGGQSWDVIDAIIPGLDNTFMKDIGRIDSYSIDCRDNVLAVAIFSQINDVRIFKTTNGGSSWTNTRILDFPIDNYEFDQGYSISDLPTPTPEQPNPLAILTSDGSGNILIDKNGMVHVFYSEMYIQDNIASDFIFERFHESEGIAYWNENFGADSIQIIAQSVDLNGDDIIDTNLGNSLPPYQISMTSQPSPAVDEYNNLYLAYTAVMEGADYRQNDQAEQYRHIMLIHSNDGGETWSAPFDAIEASCFVDPESLFYTEAVFPSMVRDIEDDILFIYHQDFNPGTSFTGGDQVGLNYIRFVKIPIGELNPVKVNNLEASNLFRLQLFPNPTADEVNISFELENRERITIELLDLMGHPIKQSLKTLTKGYHQIPLSLNNVSSGIYFVRLFSEKKAVTAKLLVL